MNDKLYLQEETETKYKKKSKAKGLPRAESISGNSGTPNPDLPAQLPR